VNLPPVMRVVVCAALVALGLAGAELLPTQPVAGQETRPGALRGAAALDRLKQDGQYDSLQAAMRQARFNVSRAEATPLGREAWRAPNPAAGYDAYVTEAGVSIAVSDQSYVSLSLHSLGYGAELQAVAPGEVFADKQTINLTRAGGVREWYVNGPDGLEHGFTLNEPPSGARQKGAPLRLALQVSEGWRAAASEDGKLVTLRGPHDEAVEYGKLVVRDNLGRNIAARLTVADEQVVIEAEDHDAVYPLTIDPLFTLQQKLTAADGAANDYLGYAVALDGDTALVGAPYDDVNGMEQGSAYVFVRNGAGWTQQARLIAQQDGTSFDYFGIAVALDGDTALVGAVYGPGSVGSEQGAVYVFVRGGTTWTQQARLNAGDGQSQDQFGAAVALRGDTALVGAFNHQISSTSGKTGAAYIFVRNGGAWTQQARLSANDGEADDRFGFSVALDGDTALIGAPADNVGANADQGSAYFFTRNGTGWTQQPRLNHGPAAANDQFGNAVALSGEKALIGAYLYGSDDQGAVFTFKRRAAGWAGTDTTRAPNPKAGAHFGVSVAMSGDTAVVGASLGLFTQGVDQRSAYVFVYGGEWFLVRHLGPELGAANDRFGYAVALDGDTALVGAYRGAAAGADQGAAYAFVLRDSRSVEQQKLFANDGAAGDYFGAAVTLDADTLAVGVPGDDIGANGEQGSVYVFTRSGAVWTFQQKLIATDGAAGANFGDAVALDGDTLAVGAPFANIGTGIQQGAVYAFTRAGATWTQQPRLTANDGEPFDYFGAAVALSGGALVVGAHGAKIGANDDQGSAYVFTRAGATQPVWTQQQKLTANDGAADDVFGYAVALDADTLAVGAYGDAIGANVEQGSVYVFTRGGAGWTQQGPKLTANDGAANDFFGAAVALGGDTLAVGASGDAIGANVRQGSAYIFTRGGAGWTQQQKLTANDGGGEAQFGQAVGLSGNNVVIGASGTALGANRQQGAAYVFTGVGGLWYQQQKLTASDGAAQERFGRAVALSGDTVAIGSLNDTIGMNSRQGSVYVFVSPPCTALTIAPASLPNGALSATYNNQQLTASGSGVGDYQFAVSSGALPLGLRMDPDGQLYGTPTATGTYRFTITGTFLLSGCTGSREYTLTITPQCPAITINPASLPAAPQGRAYNQTLTAAGGAAPYSFAITTGALPPGMSLSAGGVLSGAPTQPGSFPFTITATAANGCVGKRAYTLAVAASETPRLARLAPNAARMGTNGLILTVTGASFTASQSVQWNGGNCETSFVSATQLRAVIPAALLTSEGVATVLVVDTANGAKSNPGKFRVVGAVAHASAASYNTITLAPDSIVAAFGANLATEARVVESLPLPTELAGTTVTIRDSQGTAIRAPLFFVSPAQVNYLMPPSLANGVATVTITNGNGVAVESLTEISAVAPGLFSANASGEGPAAAVALRIRANGEQVYEPVTRYDAQTQTFVPLPIDLSNAAEQVYLILFGSGIRQSGQRGASEDVAIKFGETELPVAYAGAAPGSAGLDQVNMLLPASLRGRGEQTLVLRVNDELTNGVNVRFQ